MVVFQSKFEPVVALCHAAVEISRQPALSNIPVCGFKIFDSGIFSVVGKFGKYFFGDALIYVGMFLKVGVAPLVVRIVKGSRL